MPDPQNVRDGLFALERDLRRQMESTMTNSTATGPYVQTEARARQVASLLARFDSVVADIKALDDAAAQP